MPAPSRRARHDVRPRAPSNLQGISTSVRGEAPRYRELAEYAQAHGYADISPSQIHEAVMAGLLPPTGEQVSRGRRGFVTIPSLGVEAQLLALCRFRRTTKSRSVLRVLLWSDGWPISIDRLRADVLRALPSGSPVPGRTADERLDALDAKAREQAPRMPRQLRLGRLRSEDAVESLLVVLEVANGLGREMLDEDAALKLEQFAGLAPRARDDPLGEEPWLSGPALSGLALLRGRFSVARLRALVRDASAADFEAARSRARFLVHTLPDAVRVLELALGQGYAGLGGLRIGPQVAGVNVPAQLVAWTLFFAAEGYGEVFDAAARSFEELPASPREMLQILEH